MGFQISGGNILAVFGNTIDELDVDDAKNAATREQAASTWDKVLDWFCGTDRVKAKELIYDYFKADNSPEGLNKKIDIFKELKQLVMVDYQEHFVTEETFLIDKSDPKNIIKVPVERYTIIMGWKGSHSLTFDVPVKEESELSKSDAY